MSQSIGGTTMNAHQSWVRFALLIAMLWASQQTAWTNEPQEAIAVAFAKSESWDFNKTPLSSALKSIANKAHLAVICDLASIEQQWIDLEQILITHKSQAEPLDATLAALLTPNKLTWVVRNEVILVTTPEAAAERYSEVKLYKVTRKIAPARRVESIRTSIAPQSWALSGGAGDITSLPPNFIVISQSPGIHREVAKAFASSVSTVAGPRLEPFDSAKSNKALESPIAIHANAGSLAAVLRMIAKENRLGLSIHDAALKEAKIDLNALNVTMGINRGPRSSSVLSLALELSHPDLTWTLNGDMLLITTRSALGKILRKQTYDISDIASKIDGKYLVEAIEYNVYPKSWQFGGGDGKIELTEQGKLEVEQSENVLREIEQLLSDVRYGLAEPKEKKALTP